MNRTALRELVTDCYRLLGPTETAHLVDGIKAVGFHYATRGGMTIAVDDITDPRPRSRPAQVRPTSRSTTIDKQFQRGLITDDERYEQVVNIWKDTTPATMQRPDDAMALDPTGRR